MVPLPIDDHLPAIRDAVERYHALIVVAPPGAGKTTRVPPALLDRGALIMLQPRRVAARALAQRIAEEQSWTLGEEIGWQIRLDRRYSARTRLLVATEGILTARLQSDPLLSGFATVILDEFHERSIHTDLGLAFVKQAMLAREDLAVVVMSATLDATKVSRYLGDAPIIEVAGRAWPVDIEYRPGVTVESAVREALQVTRGHVLCFLPGAREIGVVVEALRGEPGIVAMPLLGSLPAEEQDRAVRPSTIRKVIVATNVAETSLTIEGVTAVVDSGQQKSMRYDAARGVNRFVLERIPRASADQRAGRAGRTSAGRAWRLWDSRDLLEEEREPEIRRIDLSAALLEVLAWGGDPSRFEWFETPPATALEAASTLLSRLGATSEGKLTSMGAALRQLPLHPRLARFLVGTGGRADAAMACAVLSDRDSIRPSGVTSRSDLLTVAEDAARTQGHRYRPTADDLRRRAIRAIENERLVIEKPPSTSGENADAQLLFALLCGYPDRVARRRESGLPALLLASGHGARLAPESGVREGDFLIALDVSGAERRGVSEAIVRLASSIEKEWLSSTRIETTHEIDDERLAVRAWQREWYDAILLRERVATPLPGESEKLLATAVAKRITTLTTDTAPPGPGGSRLEQSLARTVRLLQRARFAEVALDLEALAALAVAGKREVTEVDLASHLPYASRQAIERNAPESVEVPSGRRVELFYRADGEVIASVKLQELFGLAESPRIGSRNLPVTLSLLAPSGRPVQTTRDLRSFWERTYPEVRKELRGRYPKHPWPEDPWTAKPTAKTRKRM